MRIGNYPLVSTELLHRAAEKLRPLFGPTRSNEPGYYSRRIVHALRTKEKGTRLAHALALWRTVYIGDWNRPEGYENWLKSLRVLIEAIDQDDAEKEPQSLEDRGDHQPDDLEQKLNRILAKLDEVLESDAAKVNSSYVSIKTAARLTGLSTTHIRRAIKQQELMASNVGTLSHPTWRVAVSDLTDWMEKKKGGTTIPPKTELTDLVNRYFGGD